MLVVVSCDPPVVHLHASLLERLRAEDSAAIWQRNLLDAGLLVTPPPFDGHGWCPGRGLRDVARSLDALIVCEDRVTAVEVHKPFRSGAVHPGVPAAMIVVAWSLANLVGSKLWGIWIAAIGFGALALAGLAYMLWFDREKRRLLDALKAERDRLRAGLVADVEGLLRRSFVARAGGRLLLCEPHRIWAETRLLALPRPVGEARELSALRSELEQLVAGQRARQDAALAAPPAVWIDLGVDVGPLARRLAEAGHRPPDARRALEGMLTPVDQPAS